MLAAAGISAEATDAWTRAAAGSGAALLFAFLKRT
jgi:hypothetical protein